MVFAPDVQRKCLQSVSPGEEDNIEGNTNRFSLVFRCMKTRSSDINSLNSTTASKLSTISPDKSIPIPKSTALDEQSISPSPHHTITGTTHTLLIGSSVKRDFNQ